MAAKCITILPDGPSARRCLCCAKPFFSAGSHERICPKCKESEEWIAGAVEFPLAAIDSDRSAE